MQRIQLPHVGLARSPGARPEIYEVFPGTNVANLIPRTSRAEPDFRHPRGEGVSVSAARVLIVEDNPGALEALSMLLEDEGFDVIPAPNGRIALERFDTANPDVVLTDLHMPGISGLDVLAAVLERAPNVPVVMMTSDFTPENISCAFRGGAADFMAKPLVIETIATILRNAMTRDAHADASADKPEDT